MILYIIYIYINTRIYRYICCNMLYIYIVIYMHRGCFLCQVLEMQQSKQQAEPEVDAKDGSTLVKQRNFG